MKTILLSIKPEWVAKILNGEKTIEIRKTVPKCELPVKVYIYCSKQGRPLVYGSPCPGYIEPNYVQTYNWNFEEANKVFGVLNGKVVAKFTLNKVEEIQLYKENIGEVFDEEILKKSCLTSDELGNYLWSKIGEGYAWHIDDLDIFDEPKELLDFGLTKAPQSWQYVENKGK